MGSARDSLGRSIRSRRNHDLHPVMRTTQLKESDYFVAWILFFICAMVGGTIAGFIGGFVVGFVLGIFGVGTTAIQAAGGLVGFLLALPVSYLLFRVIVAKFIVGKLEPVESAPEPLAPPTY